MASEEEFARQDEELVDLRFSLRRADSELEMLRRERNLLRKELVMREAELERAREFLDRAHLLARAESAEAIADERLSRLQALESALSKLRRKPSAGSSAAASAPAASAPAPEPTGSTFASRPTAFTARTGEPAAPSVAPEVQPQAPVAPEPAPVQPVAAAQAEPVPGFVSDPVRPIESPVLRTPRANDTHDTLGDLADLPPVREGEVPPAVEGSKRLRRFQSRRALP